MSQVDPKFQTHMASHAPPEMKVWHCKDDYKWGGGGGGGGPHKPRNRWSTKQS